MLYKKSAVEIVALLRKKELSSLDVVKESIERIEKIDSTINALPEKIFDQAIRKAKNFDFKSHKENHKSLLGLPIAVKDYNHVGGAPTTFGSVIFRDNLVSKSDATVSTLESNGAIPIAKSNVPEWAGGHTDNPVYGFTRNPWDTKKSVGGSSGGSAAALATGQVWLATGNDLGGSLRTPAAFNGIVGLRPTPGVVPRGKEYPTFDTLWVEGPMARNIEDLALMLDAGSGNHKYDPLSFNHPCTSFLSATKNYFIPKRIAFSQNLNILPVEQEIAIVCESSLKKLSGLNIEFTEEIPNFKGSIEAFHTLRGVLMATMMDDLIKDHSANIPEHIRKNAEYGLKVSNKKIIQAEKLRWHLNHEINQFFKTHDFLICPATSVSPFPLEEPFVSEINGVPCKTYIDWFAITFILTLTGCPILTVPCGLTKKGLPIGLQIVSKPKSEDTLLSFGKLIQDTFNFNHMLPINPKN